MFLELPADSCNWSAAKVTTRPDKCIAEPSHSWLVAIAYSHTCNTDEMIKVP